jgi:hypothetical protein
MTQLAVISIDDCDYDCRKSYLKYSVLGHFRWNFHCAMANTMVCSDMIQYVLRIISPSSEHMCGNCVMPAEIEVEQRFTK